MWQFILGIILTLFTSVLLGISISRTPHNLRGWYGLMFVFIALCGFIGGITLAVIGATQLWPM